MTHSKRFGRHGLAAVLAIGTLAACTSGSGGLEATSPEPSATETSTTASQEPTSEPEPEASASEPEESAEGEPTDESPSPTAEEPPVDTVAMLEELWESTDDQSEVCELWRRGDFRTMLRDYDDGWDFAIVDEHYEDRCSIPAGPDGSRQDPFPSDALLTGGDWIIRMADVNLSAADVVAAENQFNDPPPADHQYVMIDVSVAYNGESEPVDPWRMLDFAIVGSGGNTFTDSCGVIPNPLRDVGDMYSGASANGNVCLTVATEQIDGATLRGSSQSRV